MTEVSVLGGIPIADLPAQLGEDLIALIHRCNVPVQTTESLDRLDTPSHRSAAFCLLLADGNLIKARRAWSAERAAQISYFLVHLCELGFPRLLGTYKSALLLEWVYGENLSNPVNVEQLRKAAQLQGQLHRTPVPDDCPYHCQTDINHFATRIIWSLRKLCDSGALTVSETEVLLSIAISKRPQEAEVGIIHTDLCPDNLVISSDGRLRSVDNESLQIGYLDLDLARSWYRWPLDKKLGIHFLASYSQFRACNTFRAHFPFWFIAVLLDSAIYRLGSPSKTWLTPVSRLQAFAYDPSGETCDD